MNERPLSTGARSTSKYDLVVGLNCAFSQVVCGLDSATLRMGETVVVQGAGGLGMYAVAVARDIPASPGLQVEVRAIPE